MFTAFSGVSFCSSSLPCQRQFWAHKRCGVFNKRLCISTTTTTTTDHDTYVTLSIAWFFHPIMCCYYCFQSTTQSCKRDDDDEDERYCHRPSRHCRGIRHFDSKAVSRQRSRSAVCGRSATYNQSVYLGETQTGTHLSV